jgi:Phospholipase A2-like domain
LHQFAGKRENFRGGFFNSQQKYSYRGPATKYDQRIERGKEKNDLDSMCKMHDKFYNESSETKDRNISDITSAHRADEIANNPKDDVIVSNDSLLMNHGCHIECHIVHYGTN